jgi:hypothetical protein
VRFTIKGSRNGSRVQVTWTDGVLTGDPPTLDLLAIEAELTALHTGDRHSWAAVTDPQGILPADSLRDPEGAWTLIASVLDSVTAGDGDLPAGAAERLGRRRIPSIAKENR